MKTFKDVLNEAKQPVALTKLETAITSFLRKQTSQVRKEDPKLFGNKVVLAIAARYWGSWEFPKDAWGDDEDDGDYDWEVLTSKSSKELQKFIQSLDKRFKKYKVYASVEEKNWLNIVVEKI